MEIVIKINSNTITVMFERFIKDLSNTMMMKLIYGLIGTSVWCNNVKKLFLDLRNQIVI